MVAGAGVQLGLASELYHSIQVICDVSFDPYPISPVSRHGQPFLLEHFQPLEPENAEKPAPQADRKVGGMK